MQRILALVLTICLFVPASALAEPVRIGVILDMSDELKVEYIPPEFKEEVQGAAVAGLFLTPIGGGLIAGAQTASRNKQLTERLRASAGDELDRATIMQNAFADEFAEHTSNIELVFLSPDVLRSDKPNFKQIDADATPYVVVVEETQAGMATLKIKWGTLSPYTRIELRVYDAKKKKRILKEKLEGIADPLTDINVAVDTAEPFNTGYPTAVDRLSYATYWRLNGKNILHLAAKGSEHAAEFVSIEDVLADNAKRFEVERSKMKGWKYPKSGTPYLLRAEPKKDRRQFGLLTDVDLLVESLGQPFENLDDYLAMRITRLADQGYGVDDPQVVPVLSFDEEWTSFMASDPRGGVGIFLHKKIGDMVFSHHIIVLDEDPLPLLTKYKADVESYIENTVLTLN